MVLPIPVEFLKENPYIIFILIIALLVLFNHHRITEKVIGKSFDLIYDSIERKIKEIFKAIKQKNIKRYIFKNNNIYPYNCKIKDHYKNYYETVFVGFLPFFTMENSENLTDNFMRTKKITFEEAVKDFEALKNIPDGCKGIYIYDGDEFPTDEEILAKGNIISWEDIVKGAGLNDKSELNRGLKTSIGALKEEYRKEEFAEKIRNYTSENSIFHPVEGRFDIFIKAAMYKIFKLFNKNKVKIVEEFYDKEKLVLLDEITEESFCEYINIDDRYIYSKDKEILFTIDWDSFFFILGTKNEAMMQKIISNNLVDGFLCDSETSHYWDFKPGELED